jgi:Carboxypeptidase regulatory-like domain
VQTFSASGRVIDGETGKPVAGARFGLQLKVDGSVQRMSSGFTTSNAQGEFTLENLQPARYEVFVMSQQGSNLRSEHVPFEVTSEPVKGLVVKMLKGATVSGIVTIENTTDKAVIARLSRLVIFGAMGDRSPGYAPNWSPVAPDGGFALTGLEEGQLTVSLGGSEADSLKGFSIARVERDGVEQSTIKVNNGENIQGVRVALVFGNATVRGTVKWPNDKMPPGARAFVSLLRAADLKHVASSPVDSRGHFLAEALPAGLYSLQLNVYIPGNTGKPYPTITQQVNVADGGVTEVTITAEPITP